MSAMWMGRVDRLLVPPERRASRSIELISPTISRRFSSSLSRKCSNSFVSRPAWFFRGFRFVATRSGSGVPSNFSCGALEAWLALPFFLDDGEDITTAALAGLAADGLTAFLFITGFVAFKSLCDCAALFTPLLTIAFDAAVALAAGE